jgi:hypothetical protein
MTKLEQKLQELGYEYYRPQFENFIYVKKFFFHTWIVIIDENKEIIQHSRFSTIYGKLSFNFIAYIRYKKDLEILKECDE